MGRFFGLFAKREEPLAERIRIWLHAISTQETLPPGILALYIGLFEGDTTYRIYLIGSRSYDAENSDWACDEDFEPERKYLDSGVPTSLDWQTFQAQVVEAVRAVLGSADPTVLREVEHVSVGFDSGDLTHIV